MASVSVGVGPGIPGSVLLCGSRGLVVPGGLAAGWVSSLCPGGWLLLSGGARGVDSVAPFAASLLGWEFAPLVRNEELLQLASCVVAVWDGRSPGTAFVLRRAAALGRPVLLLRPDPAREVANNPCFMQASLSVALRSLPP